MYVGKKRKKGWGWEGAGKVTIISCDDDEGDNEDG